MAVPADFRLTLWAGSVMPFSIDDRITAALAGGFAQTTLFTADIRRWRLAGRSDLSVKRDFMDAGLTIRNIDPLVKWLPTRELSSELGTEELAIADFEIADLLEMAVSFGADLITAVDLSGVAVDPEVGAESFATVCQLAADVGVSIQLEAMPYSGIPDLKRAWEIVRRADQANSGLTVDAWHLYRGPSTETDLELLATIPPSRILGVQINDALSSSPMALRVESMHGRVMPGDGAFDIAAFLRAVPEPPPYALVGPEVFSDDLWTLLPEELGKRLGERSRSVLLAANAPPRSGHVNE